MQFRGEVLLSASEDTKSDPADPILESALHELCFGACSWMSALSPIVLKRPTRQKSFAPALDLRDGPNHEVEKLRYFHVA
jgi:hypothetical protein